ncbi:hypothetical protein E5D57_001488 [Metarhizium anisopliae]|nr:hypothetical protein E5D57_001488 [Metarhizium anisopliae]
MKALASILVVLAASLAEGYLVSPQGTPAPGATKDCSAWVQQSLGQTCASIESAYGMSSAKFQEWLDNLCVYCIIVIFIDYDKNHYFSRQWHHNADSHTGWYGH